MAALTQRSEAHRSRSWLLVLALLLVGGSLTAFFLTSGEPDRAPPPARAEQIPDPSSPAATTPSAPAAGRAPLGVPTIRYPGAPATTADGGQPTDAGGRSDGAIADAGVVDGPSARRAAAVSLSDELRAAVTGLAQAGTIAGEVAVKNGSYESSGDEESAYGRSNDPGCPRYPKVHTLFHTSAGKVVGVLVRVIGLKQPLALPTQTADFDLDGCRFSPPFQLVVPGQSLRIKNSGKARHELVASTEPFDHYREPGTWDQPGLFGITLPANSAPLAQLVNQPPGTFFLGCKLHHFEHAQVVVVDNPYFALTDAGGRYELRGVPTGTYEVQAGFEEGHLSWVEKQTVVVTTTATTWANFRL